VLDYRLAPEHPFPAALAAYDELIRRHDAPSVAVGGDSAGGGLSFATLVAARDRTLAMPGCVVGISPWVNLGTENPSYDRLAAVDPMLSREVIGYFAPRYAAGADVRDPRLSPLFARLQGLPPTLIQIGDREAFFGDATAMHECLIGAGVDSELVVWKGMFHVWHLYWPMLAEGRRAIAEIAAFVRRHCGG
jgi:acetyl esterase/lipase